MYAKNQCDITISIDCDGQDDINAMDEMISEYSKGAEIVYGVRSKRDTDTFFKRFTAECYYKILNKMLSLAFDRITSLSIKPICLITGVHPLPII